VTGASTPPVSSSDAPAEPGWVRRLWGYMLRHRRDMTLAMGAAILGSICQTVVPLVARQIVDGVILEHTSALWPWLVLLVALATATFGFSYVRRYRGGRMALGVQYELRNDMHDHLQALDFDNLGRMPTGQLVSRANSDSTLVQGLLNFFPIMSSNVLLMVFSLAVMAYLSPLLALVSLVVAPSLLVVSYRMRWRIFPATWDGQQREGDVIQIVDEDLNGVRVVKAFGQESRELERVAESSRVLYGSQMRAVRLQSRYQPLLEAIPTLAQVAILALGGWLALHHRITLGTFLAFSTYVTQLLAPARQLAGVLTIGQQARAGIERIFQLLDTPPAIADPPDAIELPTLRGEITFSDVHFHYGEGGGGGGEEGGGGDGGGGDGGGVYSTGEPVLAGVDLHLAPGERVAIVGPSGSGKSTLAMLVPRFYDPQRGRVLVDGHDVRSVSRASLRQQIGVVFEESFLFSDTVRSNIAYGRPDATVEEVEAAARAAQAHEFIDELPDGYDTVVGERGLTLSGGQRQRIALARAILYDPRILILDDATSAIDARIEESIHGALRQVMAGRTTLLIAHRRSTLHLADRIMVLEHGAVVEQGTHEELTGRSPLYRGLLSGLEEEDAEKVGDRIEVLATMATSVDAGTTASAWGTGGRDAAGPAARAVGAPSIGPGLGGGGGRGGGGGGGGSTWPRPPSYWPVWPHCARCRTMPWSTSGSSPVPTPDSASDASCPSSADPSCSGCSWWPSMRWPRWPARCWSRSASTAGCRPARRRSSSAPRPSSWR
jgi:ATP-binding cassette subfamily B protein